MIPVARHGWDPDGLIRYLMGPGRAEEHRRPRVIASWDGLDTEWQPATTGPGEWDLELGRLCRAMRAPAIAAGLPTHDDGSTKKGYVWHLSARLAEADRVLSDAEWAQAARELVAGANVATVDDPGGARWIAIRHADDHIHVAAVLVRQDTCRRFWPSHDWVGLRRVAQDLERRWGLTRTAAADGTAAKSPVRSELAKAHDQGREPARLELARAVRVAVLAGDGPSEFAAALQAAGYLVELRRAPSGDVIGYKVARADDVTAAGNPVWFSGSKLAPDLSMPRLQQRWTDGPPPAGRGLSRATRRHVEQARRRVAADRGGWDGWAGDGGADGRDRDVAELVSATGDLLVGARIRMPELGDAAQVFDRASRAPRGTPPGDRAVGAGLRHAARQLVRHRRLAGGDDQAAMVALLVAVAALVHEIAGWLRDRDRHHQAVAAETAAAGVDRCAQSMTATAANGGADRGATRGANHGQPATRRQRVRTDPTTTARPRGPARKPGTAHRDTRGQRPPGTQLALPLRLPGATGGPPGDRSPGP
jgi:hypothetical protein